MRHEGLLYIADGTELACLQHAVRIGRGGQHHDGQLLPALVAAYLFKRLESAHDGHLYIEQDELRTPL